MYRKISVYCIIIFFFQRKKRVLFLFHFIYLSILFYFIFLTLFSLLTFVALTQMEHELIHVNAKIFGANSALNVYGISKSLQKGRGAGGAFSV